VRDQVVFTTAYDSAEEERRNYPRISDRQAPAGSIRAPVSCPDAANFRRSARCARQSAAVFNTTNTTVTSASFTDASGGRIGRDAGDRMARAARDQQPRAAIAGDRLNPTEPKGMLTLAAALSEQFRTDEAIERAQSHLAAFGRAGAITPGEMAGDDGSGYRGRFVCCSYLELFPNIAAHEA